MIELLELSEVLKAVERTGTEVRYFDKECTTSKAAGWYELSANVDRLVICPNNQRNHSDLFDTIRHEAIHVVQACNHGPVLEHSYYVKNAPQDVKSFVYNNYPTNVHHHELEAAHAAKYLSEKQIVNMINKFCFE